MAVENPSWAGGIDRVGGEYRGSWGPLLKAWGASMGPGHNGLPFLLLQATDNDVGTFGEVNYFFSDDPDR